jgi:two-component system OmpR family response regulator
VRILLLEDDRETAAAVVAGLTTRGYEVCHAADSASALALEERHRFDAAILDLMVPGGGDGYTVLDRLRARDPGVPVLILTARDSVEDRVEGLRRGADDYLVKPFAFVELAARLVALLRRPHARTEVLYVGQLEIDPLRRSVTCASQALSVTQKEFDLLLCLASRAGEVLTRKELLAIVWGYHFDPGTNVVDVHVTRLRRKLEAAGAHDVIRTVRGIGYALAE